MKSRFDVLLNDVSLTGLHQDICVTDISYPASAPEYTVANFAGRPGGMPVRNHQRQTVVSVSFEIHVYGAQARQTACQEVVRWAENGGKLQTSDRPDQYLLCVCTKLPSVESASKWTDSLTVEFTAYTVPYWMGLYPAKTVISGASAQGVIFVPGNAETRPSVKITASAAITTLTVAFGDTSVTLSGLTVSSGDEIVFAHDDANVLSVKTGETSLLSKITVTSSDDLYASCGSVPVSVTAGASVTAEFTAKGGWY